jgi:hypothetical protein
LAQVIEVLRSSHVCQCCTRLPVLMPMMKFLPYRLQSQIKKKRADYSQSYQQARVVSVKTLNTNLVRVLPYLVARPGAHANDLKVNTIT